MPVTITHNSHTHDRLTQDIVSKLWNLCNVLKDDGVTYHQYVTELTYLLFLKMAKETGQEQGIPEEWRWDALESLDGPRQMKHYQLLLLELGSGESGSSPLVQEIYANASSFIKKPVTLTKLVSEIDKLDWYSARQEGLGDLYEGLLQKNASKPGSHPPARSSIASPQPSSPRHSAASWCPRTRATNRRAHCSNGSGRPVRRMPRPPATRGVVGARLQPTRFRALLMPPPSLPIGSPISCANAAP